MKENKKELFDILNFNAVDARNKSDNSMSTENSWIQYYANIIETIKTEALKGNRSAYIEINSIPYHITLLIAEQLKNRYFIVSHSEYDLFVNW